AAATRATKAGSTRRGARSRGDASPPFAPEAPAARSPEDRGTARRFESWPPPWRGPLAGRRALYDRRAQRRVEHWSLAARALSRLLARPDGLLRLLGETEPREVDGRVLNRSLQAMLAVSSRVGSLAVGGPSVEGTFEPAAMRAQLRRMATFAMPSRTDVHVVGRSITGPSGAPLALRTYRRFGTGLGGKRAAAPGIAFFHGGGWVMGDLDSHDGSCRLLAAVTGCVVVAVDYRLAPEAPFPAAVDDALAAYGWIHEHAGELGIAAGQVAVMGDSAGGTLAAVVAQQTRSGAAGAEARPAPAPPPVAQVLVYPALDTRLESASMAAFGDGFFLTRPAMEYFRSAYLPDPATWADPSAAPLFAEDVSGLAPALVVTAGFDPLHDDGEAYVAKLAAAGVEVEHRCYPDQVHGFFGMGIAPDSLALSIEVCDAAGRLVRRSAGAEEVLGARRS
ncbi:MAG: alpha/beta hydrolase, partial [Acidimicrobiales bacterium]